MGWVFTELDFEVFEGNFVGFYRFIDPFSLGGGFNGGRIGDDVRDNSPSAERYRKQSEGGDDFDDEKDMFV